jgi:hypothetical protein
VLGVLSTGVGSGGVDGLSEQAVSVTAIAVMIDRRTGVVLKILSLSPLLPTQRIRGWSEIR